MLSCIVLSAAALAITLLLGSATFAQTPPAPTHTLVTIATGNKFQQLLASSGTPRRMLPTSNNNNNDDSCWVFVGSGRASKEGGSTRRGISPLPAVCAIGRDPGNLRVEFRHSRCRISIRKILASVPSPNGSYLHL